MEVLLVTPRYPPRTGGVETHVRELATRLAARGHAVTVVTADRRPGEARVSRVDDVRVVRRRGIAPGGAGHVAPGVAATVRASGADVVHAHNYHSLPLVFAAAGVGDDQRFVVTPHYHGASASAVRNALLGLYRFPGGWALKRADAAIAVSDWERGELARDFGVDARVIPNGLDRDRFADAEPESRDRPYVLSVGRLEAYKGVGHAVRALAELPEYDLVVAGRGPDRERLDAVAREAGVRDRVAFEGYVDDDRLPALYAGASVYVTLSAFEAFGLTVQEAIAARTPCVVRRAGALADWVETAGVVGVSGTDPTDVADAVRAAAGTSPDPTAVVAWRSVVDRIEAVYRGE